MGPWCVSYIGVVIYKQLLLSNLRFEIHFQLLHIQFFILCIGVGKFFFSSMSIYLSEKAEPLDACYMQIPRASTSVLCILALQQSIYSSTIWLSACFCALRHAQTALTSRVSVTSSCVNPWQAHEDNRDEDYTVSACWADVSSPTLKQACHECGHCQKTLDNKT